MLCLTRGGFFVGFPIPRKKIPIPWDFFKMSGINMSGMKNRKSSNLEPWTVRDCLGFWDLSQKKIPIPKIPGFYIWDFFEKKSRKSRDLGSQKNPIPKPPLGLTMFCSDFYPDVIGCNFIIKLCNFVKKNVATLISFFLNIMYLINF